MKFLRITFPIFLFIFLALKISAQPSASERPRLVIGIFIDGLQQKHIDMLWKNDDWKTEWLDNNWTAEQLLEFVLEIINERHLQIKQVK